MGVAVLVSSGCDNTCLECVGEWWLYVPVRVSVMGVHMEQFVDQVVVVCMEARCGVPLALLLEVSEVGVFPGVCGFWWGFCEKLDQLFIG